MPSRDVIHLSIKQALIKEGWKITDDPYVISYGERFLFVDLGARSNLLSNLGQLVGAQYGDLRIAVEIKAFRGKSAIADLEQAMGQYALYRLLLDELDPERVLYLAIDRATFETIFNEPIGKLVIRKLPLKLIIVDVEMVEVIRWIPYSATKTS